MPEPWRALDTVTGVTEAPGKNSGGGERDRTDDLLLAKQALSQLSYTPVSNRGLLHRRSMMCRSLGQMVGLDGFEPSTPALSRRCSNRLSYRPSR